MGQSTWGKFDLGFEGSFCRGVPDAAIMTDKRDALMRRAIELSRNNALQGQACFGSLLADEEGNILVEACNSCVSSGDVTRHAETELVRKACAELDREQIARATVYTSTEPCVLCCGAIYWSGCRKIVYGCDEVDFVRIVAPTSLPGKDHLNVPARDVFSQFKAMSIEGPLLAEEALAAHREAHELAQQRQASL